MIKYSILVPMVASIGFLVSCNTTPSNEVSLKPGEQKTVMVSTHCGYEWLEIDINEKSWVTSELGADTAGNPTELAWPQGETATLELELINSEILQVTAKDSSVTHIYKPGDNPPACM